MGEFKSYLNNIKLKLRELEDYSKNEEILLVMYSLNQTREKIFLKNTISCQEKQKINRKLFRRMKGEPLNKIFKKQNFYGFDFTFVFMGLTNQGKEVSGGFQIIVASFHAGFFQDAEVLIVQETQGAAET